MLRAIATVLLIASLAACRSHPPTVNLPPPVIRSIALIPATNPLWFSFENSSPPVGYPFQYWVNKVDSHSKARRFNDALKAQDSKLGDAFTQAVVSKLREHGFTVEILEDVQRVPDDPDNVEYEKIKTHADAIVHIRLSEIGMWSSRLSTKYIPRVNAAGKLWANGREDSIYSDEVDYGVDAKKGKAWGILPDPKFSYGSFDEVMSHVPEIQESFDTGVKLVAERISQQIIDSARPYEPASRSSP